MYPPLHQSILDIIGRTPMLELRRIINSLRLKGRLLAKLEILNPGGSKKDRAALQMMQLALQSGHIRPGQCVVEVTSGNTGTGLAIVCAALGHPFVAVMSSGNSPERSQMMRAFGAEVVLVPQAPDSVSGRVSGADLELVYRCADVIVREREAFFADQMNNAANALAHECHTGPEIWEQSGGSVDVFVDFAGTGGSFGGCVRYLKQVNPKLRAYVIEPAGNAALATGRVMQRPHAIQGGGYSRPHLKLIDQAEVSGYLTCTDEQAIAAARMLARDEGVLGGFSSGANLYGAIHLLETFERGSTVAFLASDTGMKYLSTDLYPLDPSSTGVS